MINVGVWIDCSECDVTYIFKRGVIFTLMALTDKVGNLRA